MEKDLDYKVEHLSVSENYYDDAWRAEKLRCFIYEQRKNGWKLVSVTPSSYKTSKYGGEQKVLSYFLFFKMETVLKDDPLPINQ